ncbi:MAG: aldolase/citrate lyase family protein [Nitrososphaeria archaeon]
MRKNKLRELISKDKPTLGTHVMSTWTGVIELVGHTGLFDYIEFLSTYTPWDLHDFDNVAKTTELAGISSMIKVDQEPGTFIAERALAAGIQNFLFADIRTVEDAEQAVKAVRAEPKGLMGMGMFRSVEYVFAKSSPSDYRSACDEAVIAFMIEKKSAVEHLEEILSVEGVDMIQFGPWDYSLSIGLSGKPRTPWGLNHPKVKEVELKVIKTALKMDKRPRVELDSLEKAEEYMNMGVKDFCIGTDVSILFEWWKNNGEKMRKLFSKLEHI